MITAMMMMTTTFTPAMIPAFGGADVVDVDGGDGGDGADGDDGDVSAVVLKEEKEEVIYSFESAWS